MSRLPEIPGDTVDERDETRECWSQTSLAAILCSELLRNAHLYTPGIGQNRPTSIADEASLWRRIARHARERCRDLGERAAARIGFSHRHFVPDAAARQAVRLLELGDGLEATHRMLGDEQSRRAMVDVLKLRVLGPYHAPLSITPQIYRSKQAEVDRELCRQRSTFDVSDPWFSPLSLYRVPIDGGPAVTLHSHSVDVVSVFTLNQYTYTEPPIRVGVELGDVVIDAGGCWGDTALYFAGLVGPSGRVYTFEFDPESLEIMRENLALNPELADRIEVVERALWHRSNESLEFAQAGRMTSLAVSGPERSARRVSTITVDDFVQEAGIDRLGFIKMDVEGAELSVVRGAREAVRRFSPRFAIAAYHKDDDLVRIPAALAALDPAYRFYLGCASALEDETVLFADVPTATSVSRCT